MRAYIKNLFHGLSALCVSELLPLVRSRVVVYRVIIQLRRLFWRLEICAICILIIFRDFWYFALISRKLDHC